MTSDRGVVLTLGLSKRQILRGRGAFADILARGTPTTVGSIKLFVASLAPPGKQKIGFTVARGIKSAAVRNRIKRCMREAFRLQQREIHAMSGGMILLYIGRIPGQSSEIDCRKIERDIQAVFKQASLKEPKCKN